MINSTLSLRARAVARVAIAAGVLVFCIAADCAVLAYELGRQTGAAVHARNDQLARVARRILVPEPVVAAEPEPVVAEPVVIPAEPAPRLSDLVAAAAAELAASDARTYRAIGAHTARVRAILAETEPAPAPATDWAALTVRELRSITGARSKRLRKADLVAIAAGMAA